MFEDIKYRWAFIVLLLISSAYLIWPTYKMYTLSEDEEAELSIDAMKELKEGAINLGLDLQGGMYVLLEADIPILVENGFRPDRVGNNPRSLTTGELTDLLLRAIWWRKTSV